MTAADIFLVDSNILVYYFDSAEPAKHKISKEIIDKCLDGKLKLAVSVQNLSEFFSVTTSKKILTKVDAIRTLSYFAEFSGIAKITFDHKTVVEAAAISEEYDMHYWDALLAATMKHNNILNLYTENKKDFKIPWLNAVNPFEKTK